MIDDRAGPVGLFADVVVNGTAQESCAGTPSRAELVDRGPLTQGRPTPARSESMSQSSSGGLSMARPVPPATRRARLAVSVIFAVHGAVAGTFATRIPWIADHVQTDPGGLGLA